MSWFQKLKLKPEREEEEPSPPPPFPLSLSFPIPTPCSTIKPYDIEFSSVFIVTVIFAWVSPKNVFEILWSKLTQFITTRLCTSGKTRLRTSGKTPLCTSSKTRLPTSGKTPLPTSGKTRLPTIPLPRVVTGMIGNVHWINLPLELCEEIGKRIESRLDIVRFRSVCKKWRSALPSPARFPLQVPPLPNCYTPFLNHPFVITEINYYHVNTEAVVVLEEVAQGGKFRPNTNYRTRSKNSMEHQLSQLSFVRKAYILRFFEPVAGGRWDVKFNKFAKNVVIISSNATEGVNPSYARLSDLSIVAHLGCGDMKGRLALLRLGESSCDRVWDTSFCTKVFQSIGTYRGRLCMCDGSENVFLMDYHSLRMTRVAPPVPEHLFDVFEYRYIYHILAPLLRKV